MYKKTTNGVTQEAAGSRSPLPVMKNAADNITNPSLIIQPGNMPEPAFCKDKIMKST
jgi:hypothetical protein